MVRPRLTFETTNQKWRTATLPRRFGTRGTDRIGALMQSQEWRETIAVVAHRDRAIVTTLWLDEVSKGESFS